MQVRLRTEGPLPGPAPWFFLEEQFVFNQPESLIAEWTDRDQWIRIPFCPQKQRLYSLCQSSFGGLAHSGVPTALLSEFIQNFLDLPYVRSHQEVHIRSMPQCYDPEAWAQQDEVLRSAGFRAVVTDLNMHLPTTSGSFRNGLQPSEYRYLNKARKAEWTFRKLNPSDYLTTAYALIAAARTRKGYPVTMNLPQLRERFRQFPAHFMLFGVFDGEVMIASTVCIRINDEILYDFYHGDMPEYRQHSPVVYLLSGLYQYAVNENMSLIDLGTCSDKGVENKDLCAFKRHMGGKESRKISYVLAR